MGDRITDIEDQIKEISASVAVIREKIFNGFSNTIDEIHSEVIEMRKSRLLLEELKLRSGEEFRLATCPMKKDMLDGLIRRFYIFMAIFGAAMSVVAILIKIL